MKKIFSRIALFALTLATVACSKSDIDDISPIPDTPDTPAASERISVTATIVGADQTRVTLTPDTDDADQPIVKIDWNAEGETFAVINGSNKAVFEQTSGNNFEGTLPEGDGEGEPTYRGIYPASAASDDGCTFTIDLAEQTGALDESKTFMLATSDTGLDYSFQHTTALLRPTFKVGDEALSNAVITKVVVKNTTTARAIPCFAGTQATDTTGDIIINRPTPSADDIYIYMCKPYSGGEKIDVLVYATESGKVTLYEGSINVPEGKSLTMGNLYTPTVTLSEIAATPNTILYYASEKLGFYGAPFGTEDTDYTHTFADGIGRIIKIDGNWTSIPDNAFNSSSGGVTKVILPETITAIGKRAFYNVQTLEEVVLPTTGSGYTVGVEAFYKCANLSNINLSMATTLGKEAFRECVSLVEVNLASATTLGYNSFRDCAELIKVELPNVSDSTDGNSNTIYGIDSGAFENCPKLATVVMPSDGYTGEGYTIGNSAFSGTPITAINLSKMKAINDGAFFECKNLQSVTMPTESNYTLGGVVFYSCSALADIDLSMATTLELSCFELCTSLQTANLVNATSVGESCFSECTALKSVNLPEVTTLNDYCFWGCTALESVAMPKAESLGGNCFSGCTSLKSVSLPEATSLGNYCFMLCTSLATATLPKVVSLGEGCFQYAAIESVSLPEATTLGQYCFYDCDALITADLTKAKSLGDYCFSDCDKLTTVKLAAIETIGESAFLSCDELNNVTIRRNIPPTLAGNPINCFKDCPKLKIYVVHVTGWRFRSAWSSYAKGDDSGCWGEEGDINDIIIGANL